MHLGKNYSAIIAAIIMVLSLPANSQPVKSHRYFFGSELQKTSVSVAGHSLTINYSLSELKLENITNENGTFYKIDIPGHIKSTEPGRPQMPVLSRLISLPKDGSYTIKITDVKTTRIKPGKKNIEGIFIPAQPEESKKTQTQKPAFVIDKSLYATRGFIKKDTVRIEHIGTARGVNLATIQISPVRYNPKSNILEVITSMNIEITFTGGEIKSLPMESYPFKETFAKGILNYDAGNVIPGYSDKPVKMIILTDTAFIRHLEPFIRWKTQKGFKVEMLFKGADFAGNTYSDIKSTLSYIYNSSTPDNPPPEYLLIIGNTAKIPYYGTGQVTDMYYGEFDGDGDYMPEMFIGRLPVADTNELKAVTEKIIQYEKFEFADTNLFHSNAIVSAGYDAGYANYMNGQVFYAIDNYLNEENKVNEYHFYYTQATDIDDSIKVRRDSIINLIDKGISFINYTGHGTSSEWLKLAINNATINILENQNMYPFIISNACETSSFNLSNSFGNRWVTSEKKGAIGFIGASNDTFWSEDYFWAVGLGTPSADPTYETTGLGAIDRLFHTHEESPSDWYITMGQVNFAGNLAVSASTSPILIKKQYWEIYNLVGDPSIIPIIGTPDTFDIILPDTLPNNMRSWSFTGEPFSYIAISHADTLCDASYFSPSGNVTLDLPGISDDSCLVVITGQNRIPLIKTIKFSTVSDEYINLTATVIDDSTENNNGMADFGETVSINLTISNLGSTDAENLYAKISTVSEYITMNSDLVMIGPLAAGAEIILDDNLSVSIAEGVPDLESIPIDILLKDDATEKTYQYNLTVHAPDFEVINFLLDDSVSGNGNNIADKGETVTLTFQIRNQGTSSTSGQFYVLCTDPSITILNPSPVKSDVLGYGESTSIPVSVKISEDVASGAVIYISTIFDCPPYLVSKEFSFRVGQIRESFEYESFSVFPWLNISNVPWTITETYAYDGIAAARSGDIGHNSSSVLSIKTYYSADDSLKFFYKVSSEYNYDYLIFKLNDTEIFRKSGETGWEQKVISVPSGYNKMEWIYRKDAYVISGSDCAMIDMIDFSQSGTVRYVRRDIAAARLISPVQKDKIGREKVTVKVLNEGPDTINGFNMAYRINEDLPVKEHFGNTLVPLGDSVTVSFTLPINFSRYGIYNIEVYGYDNDDDFPLNDTLKTEIEHTTIIEPFLVFPNPFNNELNIFINSDVAGTAHFALYNTTGRKVLDVEHDVTRGMNEIAVNAMHLPPALYYLRIEFPGVTRTVKVVKTRK